MDWIDHSEVRSVHPMTRKCMDFPGVELGMLFKESVDKGYICYYFYCGFCCTVMELIELATKEGPEANKNNFIVIYVITEIATGNLRVCVYHLLNQLSALFKLIGAGIW